MRPRTFLLVLAALLCSGCLSDRKVHVVSGRLTTDPYWHLAEDISGGGGKLSRRTIAVLPFSWVDGRKGPAGTLVAERLSTRLIQLGKVGLAERTLLDRVLAELKLESTGAIAPDSVKGIGKLLGVEALVLGTLSPRSDGRVEIHGRLVRTETAEALAASQALVEADWETESPAPPPPRPVVQQAPPVPQSACRIPKITRPEGWSRGPDLPFAVSLGAATAALGDRLYVLSWEGSGMFFAKFDPSRGLWETLPTPPLGRGGARMATLDGKLYVVGGCPGSDCRLGVTNALDVYDPAMDSWTAKAPMPIPKMAHAVAAYGGRLYVMGGLDRCPPCDHQYDTVEVYDPKTDRWSSAAPVPAPREHAAAVSLGGRIYVLGGLLRGDSGMYDFANTDRMDIYDPAKDRWSAGPPMPTVRGSLRTFAKNGKIHVVGGSLMETSPVRQCVTRHDVYDPAAGAWSTLADTPPLGTGYGTGLVGGKVYAVVGDECPCGSSRRFEVFTPR